MRRARMTRVGLAGMVAGLLAVTLGTIAPASAATDRSRASVARIRGTAALGLDWARCRDPFLRRFKATCAMLTVPLDHSDPGGPTIQIAVSRVLHTEEPFRGAVLTNPGGPGGSGLFLAVTGQFVPHRVGLTYDWYGLDTRGVGESIPALGCDNHYYGWNRPAYEPSTPAVMRYWRRKTERYAEDCGRAPSAALLDHVKTTDLVADYEALREAIGAEQITFYGASYGTYLAQVYATLHPERIKAMVLDGVVNPERVFYRAFLDQDRGLEKTLARFFDWIAGYPGVFHLGTTRAEVRGAYHRLHRRLTQHPADGKVGPDELDDALEPAVFGNEAWVEVARAFAALANEGEASDIERIYRDGYPIGRGSDNYHAAGLATVCTDAPWPHAWRTWREDARRVHQKAPFYTWSSTWYYAPCRTWPAEPGPRLEVSGAGITAPILMLNETQDGATPAAGALAARALFPSAALVAGVGGTSHAVGLHGIPCTDNAIANLLRDGSLPERRSGNRADKKCPPLPPPDPSARGAQTPGAWRSGAFPRSGGSGGLKNPHP